MLKKERYWQMVNYKKIDEMWDTGKFDIAQPINTGVWIQKLDLVCKTESCETCCYSDIDKFSMLTCYYSDISEDDITKYLLAFKPRELLRSARSLDYNYWFKELQKTYPIKDFPEYYI